MTEMTQQFFGAPVSTLVQSIPAANSHLRGHTQLAMQRFSNQFRLSPADLAVLTPDELARLAQAKRPEKTHRALAVRLQLRRMLSPELNCAPPDVRFVSSADGKLLLHPLHGLAVTQLDFSLTYTTEGYAVCIATGSQVGIDLQGFSPRQERNFETLFGGSYARRQLTTLAPHEIWTRMEAYGKMKGVGLAYGLHRLYRIAVDPQTSDVPCHFTDIRFGRGLALSLCTTGLSRRPVSIVAPGSPAG